MLSLFNSYMVKIGFILPREVLRLQFSIRER